MKKLDYLKHMDINSVDMQDAFDEIYFHMNDIIDVLNNRTLKDIKGLTPEKEFALKELLRGAVKEGSKNEPYISNIIVQIIHILEIPKTE